MSDFQKAVTVLRSQGIGVTVENFINNIQVAKIEGDNLAGGFSTNIRSMLFTDDELSIIRELLSDMSCGYKRTTFYHHCCDANEIIQKIDDYLGEQEETEVKL